MNEKQYLELCKLADEVLLESNATPVRISIPWLHIIREHPVFLENYESLFIKDHKPIDLIRTWLRSIHNKLAQLKTILKSVFRSDFSAWSKTTNNLSSTDVLFISHLLNISQLNDIKDFYYSDLPQRLNDDGYISVVAMLNHTGISSSQLSANQKKGGLWKLVFPRNLGFLNEFKNIKLLWKESISLRKLARSEQHSLKKKFLIGQLVKLCLHPA